MIVKGSAVRKADHPIDSLFVDRWSPRAMSGEPIDEAELFVLFEGARWAPSSGNTMAGFDYARAKTALTSPTSFRSRPWPPSASRDG